MDYCRLEKDITEKLRQGLSQELYYHCVEHSLQVISNAQIIGKAEGFKDDDLVLLKTAALLHDIGFLESPFMNEAIGSRMAGEILPGYGYSPEQIELIKAMILATAIPQKPLNLMEEIICDADLAYLGCKNVMHYTENLRYETCLVQNRDFDDLEWINFQLNFLEKHEFFTAYAREYINPGKKRYMSVLLSRKKEIEDGGE